MTNLPSTWSLCAIGDVLAPVEMTGKDETDREIWYVDISSIDNQTNRITEPKRLQLSEAPSRARQKIVVGDVLFSTVRPYLRKIAAVDAKYDGEIASTGFAVLRGATGIDPKYVFFKAISHDFVSALTGEQYGVSYPAVKEEQVRAQPLELPPSNEQRRIVEKIEAMFDEVDKGVESLQTARTTLGLYRQSLLKSAFEGRLTADWRAQNTDKLEAPETLLARIQKERDTRYKAALAAWQDALAKWRAEGENGKKPTKPKRPAELDIPSNLLGQSLPVLPTGWHWTSLSWLLSVERKPMTTGPFGTMLKKQEHQKSGVPVLGIENIGNGKFIPGNKIFVTDEKAQELAAFEANAGDLAISRSGTVGEVCEVPDCFDKVLISTNLLLVRPNSQVIESQFFVQMLQGCSAVRKQIKELCKGSSREFLNQTILSSIAFPICSPAEQAEIVCILDARLEAADALEAEIDAALSRADALRQSILKKAFSGRLVPQDPDDEPATTLLARIKADRAKTPKTKKRRTTHA
mgnify:CR=1 FL=1